MYTQDPFQTASPFGPYATFQNPTFQNPLIQNQNPAFQNPNPFGALNQLGSINPLAAILGMQQVGQPGYAGMQSYGGYPQQQHAGALQNPLNLHSLIHASLQNPLIAAALQNQLIAAAQQSQLLNALGGQQINPMLSQQYGSPYGQIGAQTAPQFGQGIPGQGIPGQGFPGQSSLAPQSWVGQGGPTQAVGQIHPLVAQLVARSLYGPSITPWGTY